ncbi:proteasomal ATPase-associated factor 1-like isoform X2 [Cimex lectularius]|uniref:WD repeat-containing protein 55 homolog n=1 Tax=Cimex lectularius TaxID=79782 RepID=A0A8I6R6F8_CIMLE|nr:proteasomal ATPase-associated factor 1-like isoform X2 [Cimex lectularius]
MTYPLMITMSDSDREAGTIDKNCLISLQSDWNLALKNIGEEVWVTWKSEGNPTLHGTIKRINDSSDCHTSIGTSNGFKVVHLKGNMIQVGHCMSSRSTIFVAPSQYVTSVHEKKSISSVAVNADGLVVSAIGEKMVVWDTKTEEKNLLLEGHLADIYKCKYFPSGKVIISCGSDMLLKIWCPFTGRCAVTLSGHKLAVTDIDFISRGKNIVSVSKDDEKEVLTEGKVVLFGCEDGTVSCSAVKSRSRINTWRFDSPVNCLTYVGGNKFVIGCQNGTIAMFKLSSQSTTPLRSWKESHSAVLSLLNFKDTGFIASRADGTVSFSFINSTSVAISLTGSNFDPVNCLAFDGNNVYTCCRDSFVRKYSVAKIIDDVAHNIL